MKLEYQECRLVRHQWERYTLLADQYRPQFGHRILVWLCPRCGMIGVDKFNYLGRRDGSRYYIAPKDYYMDSVEDRPTLEQLRLSLFESGPSPTAKTKTVKISARTPMKAAKKRRHLAAV